MLTRGTSAYSTAKWRNACWPDDSCATESFPPEVLTIRGGVASTDVQGIWASFQPFRFEGWAGVDADEL